ncbi:MAG: polyamine aminopropyltransferase [Acholeplasma sp.]|nr:polyamine aminopropyltransferase [Acholeplasma sp.]
MDWFKEAWTENIHFAVKIKSVLHSEKTSIQQIDLYDSFELGRFLALDGLMITNEKDEFIYHEMITHPALSVNPYIKHVLIIGGGDGGTLRELVKYPKIETIEVVELDYRVVELSKTYLPSLSSGFNDTRVSMFYQDGASFVKDTERKYDLIIVDSTDPIGPEADLFTQSFYHDCFRALTESGILINQHESPYFEKESKEMKEAHDRISKVFPFSKVYQAFIPTYPSGHWLFGFASKKFDPVIELKSSYIERLGFETKYYNKEIHVASFALPTYVKKRLMSK